MLQAVRRFPAAAAFCGHEHIRLCLCFCCEINPLCYMRSILSRDIQQPLGAQTSAIPLQFQLKLKLLLKRMAILSKRSHHELPIRPFITKQSLDPTQRHHIEANRSLAIRNGFLQRLRWLIEPNLSVLQRSSRLTEPNRPVTAPTKWPLPRETRRRSLP